MILTVGDAAIEIEYAGEETSVETSAGLGKRFAVQLDAPEFTARAVVVLGGVTAVVDDVTAAAVIDAALVENVIASSGGDAFFELLLSAWLAENRSALVKLVEELRGR